MIDFTRKGGQTYTHRRKPGQQRAGTGAPVQPSVPQPAKQPWQQPAAAPAPSLMPAAPMNTLQGKTKTEPDPRQPASSFYSYYGPQIDILRSRFPGLFEQARQQFVNMRDV